MDLWIEDDMKKISLIKLFRIGPVTGPRSVVLDIGPRPPASAQYS